MRLLTDFQNALLVGTVIWALWYFGPMFLDVLLDPFKDRFEDVDELAKQDFPAGSRQRDL